nr:type II secretion system pilot lipoprotein GspS [uncultured Pantoea sp.]
MSLSFLWLSGCQQQQPAREVTAEKVNQLAALIASAEWLRDHCQRSDIPSNAVVEQSANKLAEARGWMVSTLSRQAMKDAAERRYLAMSDDSILISQKCAQLNQAAVPFIRDITSYPVKGK